MARGFEIAFRLPERDVGSAPRREFAHASAATVQANNTMPPSAPAVGGSSHRRERRSLLVGWVAFGDPLHQERVRDREHHRADEEPDYPEGN